MPTSSDIKPHSDAATAEPSTDRPVAIHVERVGKRFMTGMTGGMYRYRSLREDISGLTRLGRGRADRRKAHEFWALRDVSFDIREGEAVGIIGRNGAGKSTLLKILSRITPPAEGRVELRGRIGSLLEVGTGFHPELNGRDNILLAGAVNGMGRRETLRKMDEIVEFAGIGTFLDTPVKRYSSGMYLRLGFSVAAHLEPDILLVDEVLAVGDAEFQRKCLGKMEDAAHSGRTVLFVSHSMPSILRLCPRVVLLDAGRVIADGNATTVVRTYLESGFGTTAERVWGDQTTAPGDDVVRLRSVRVVTESGEVREDVDIRRPVGIEVEYHHLPGHDLKPCVNLHFFNEHGVCLFMSNDVNNNAWWRSDRTPGLVRATCWIPGDLLAEGRIFVEAAISTFNPVQIHLDERDVVAFQVVDSKDAGGIREIWSGDLPGVMRPSLTWDVSVGKEIR